MPSIKLLQFSKSYRTRNFIPFMSFCSYILTILKTLGSVGIPGMAKRKLYTALSKYIISRTKKACKLLFCSTRSASFSKYQSIKHFFVIRIWNCYYCTLEGNRQTNSNVGGLAQRISLLNCCKTSYYMAFTTYSEETRSPNSITFIGS